MRTTKQEIQKQVYVQRMNIILGVLDEHAPEVTDIEELAHHLVGALECADEDAAR